MRRLLLAAVVTALVLVPIGGAAANEDCPTIEGTALLDFDQGGFANVSYEGERLRVPFFGVGFEPTGENTADIYFVWEFPQGDVLLVEHSVTTHKGGPAQAFNSTIDVLDGSELGLSSAYGHWTWTGTANQASGKAAITHISGELCINGD